MVVPDQHTELIQRSYAEIEERLPSLMFSAIRVTDDIHTYNERMAQGAAVTPNLRAALQFGNEDDRLYLPRVSKPENMQRWDSNGHFFRGMYIIGNYVPTGPDDKRRPIPATPTEIMGLIDDSFTPYPAAHGRFAFKPAFRRALATPECAAILVPLTQAIGEHCIKFYGKNNTKEEKLERRRYDYGAWAAQNILARSVAKHDPHTQIKGKFDRSYLNR